MYREGILGASRNIVQRLLLLLSAVNDRNTRERGIIYGRGHFNCCASFKRINVHYFSKGDTWCFPLAFYPFALWTPVDMQLNSHRKKMCGSQSSLTFQTQNHLVHYYLQLSLTDTEWKVFYFYFNFIRPSIKKEIMIAHVYSDFSLNTQLYLHVCTLMTISLIRKAYKVIGYLHLANRWHIQ